ncbi:MAG: AI-2E family transporter, partial [Clostridiales bacterium]|nr:AI-2E family transporter [Clostridiales bacterium]
MNFFIGVIVCAFFINRKEVFLAQAKKMIIAIFREDHADGILRGAAYINKTFWGFISGKLIDSLVIGILCFIVMSILHWPYAVLISVIIGVTNIIPFFGPFIGAIPSAVLMFMVSPKLCLAFIVFVFILQQVDGNIIGPKILGETTGLSSIWVIFAILVGSGLFGVLGMILGVPVFAVLYAYVCYRINRRLEKKGLSTDLWDYHTLYSYAGMRETAADTEEADAPPMDKAHIEELVEDYREEDYNE